MWISGCRFFQHNIAVKEDSYCLLMVPVSGHNVYLTGHYIKLLIPPFLYIPLHSPSQLSASPCSPLRL